MSRNNPKVLPKKPLAKKQWTAAPSKPSAITPPTAKLSPKSQKRSPAKPQLLGPGSAPKKKSLKDLPKPLVKKLDPSLGLRLLKKHYPDAHCELDHKNPFELLVATILSAQCTDVRVNLVTPALFAKYPNAKAMSKAPQADVEELIRTTGFYKNKAKNIISCAQSLVAKHKGQVPADLDALVDLAGVGRKTANVVLGNAFNITSGIVVDTHVTRLAYRFNWSSANNAESIERELQKFIPHEDWVLVSHLLIFHGRRLCKARNPGCYDCFLFDGCPRRGVK